MNTFNRPIVWATVDEANGIALITGQGHEALVHEVVPDCIHRWSAIGHGYVVNMAELSDLCSLACIRDAIWRERPRTLQTPRGRKGQRIKT